MYWPYPQGLKRRGWRWGQQCRPITQSFDENPFPWADASNFHCLPNYSKFSLSVVPNIISSDNFTFNYSLYILLQQRYIRTLIWYFKRFQFVVNKFKQGKILLFKNSSMYRLPLCSGNNLHLAVKAYSHRYDYLGSVIRFS